MVQTRSQTKKQEEIELSVDNWFRTTKKQEEEGKIKVSFIAISHGVWNLVYDMCGTYCVMTDNYYDEEGDNYHEFKAKDYDGGEPTAYRHALKCYYSRV